MMLAGIEVARTAGIARLGDIDKGRLVREGDGDVRDGLRSGGGHCWIVGLGVRLEGLSRTES